MAASKRSVHSARRVPAWVALAFEWASRQRARDCRKQNSLDNLTHFDGATRSRGGHSLGYYKLAAMKLAFRVTIIQLLFRLHCASEIKAPGDADVSSVESLFGVPNDKLRARL